MWRRKYRIRTFHVETVDGEQVYTMHHEHAAYRVMSKVSLSATEVDRTTGYPGYQPVAAGRNSFKYA
jgi:hypothetical protein